VEARSAAYSILWKWMRLMSVMNLLRFSVRKGLQPNPFFEILSAKEQTTMFDGGFLTGRKIELIKQLSASWCRRRSIFDGFL